MRCDFKYQLEKGSKKHICPRCHKKRLVRYVDVTNGNYLNSQFGRCDREVNCGYHHSPTTERIEGLSSTILPLSQLVRPTDYVPIEVVTKTQNHTNTLTEYLYTRFGIQQTREILLRYKIGTSKKWHGATVFWQIDVQERVRTGKIMLYATSGKRVKKPYNHISWVHTELKLKEYNLKQCFFGEHLLKLFPNSVVAIVESEKTALIASIHFPEFVWIATGGKNGCKWTTREVNGVLRDRHVVLFPDLGAFDDWTQKSELLHAKSVRVANTLELYATREDREAGLDLADFITRLSHEKSVVTQPNTVWLDMSAPDVLMALGDIPVY